MTEPVIAPKTRKPRTKRDLADTFASLPLDEVSKLCAALWAKAPKFAAFLVSELAATKPK